MSNVKRTCPGHCCAVFAFLDTKDERFDGITDAPFIKDMLTEIDLVGAAERFTQLGFEPTHCNEPTFNWEGVLLSNPERRLHTCKHWDTETYLCTVYENRPTMCRDYPYERECDFGCGYTNA